ncbi:MAG: hypothetical protein PVJ53_12075 [Desulfobacterales bacterium]|jgi:hypothetical protein
MMIPHRTLKMALVGILIFLGGLNAALAMSSKALVALKQAGFSDQVIQAVAREKILETAAFTVEELIQLKQAGMADETLEVLITERSFMRQAQPIIYGRAVKPLNLSSVDDLIELKRSGMNDEVIRAVIVASSQRRDEEYYRSWEMLNRMGLKIEIER